MGYELKVYVGKVCDVPSPAGGMYFQVLGMVDLSKPGSDSNVALLARRDAIADKLSELSTPIYMYDLDGNTEYVKDCYGEPLVAVGLDEVVTALEKDFKETGYPRFKVAADLLRSAKGVGYPAKVVLYGH